MSVLKKLAGRGRVAGVEAMVRKQYKGYQTWMSYTYSRAISRFDTLESTWSTSDIDRPHQFRWTHSLSVGPVEFSAGWTYRSGAPYTEPLDTFLYYDEEEEMSFLDILWGERNAVRLPDYHRLDASVWYHFKLGEVKGMLGLSVLNVYNRRNVWKRQFYIDDLDGDDAEELIQEQKYFLGITPNLTLRLGYW